MSLLWDNIAIKYVYEGYLKNIPYLVTYREICEAFMPSDPAAESYFFDNYPCLTEEVRPAYDALIAELHKQIDQLLADPEGYDLPDWVYSFMLGEVISVNSDSRDIHDLLALLNTSNIGDEFQASTQIDCLKVSEMWVRKLQSTEVFPAMPFGAPHVIKSLRLEAAAIVD